MTTWTNVRCSANINGMTVASACTVEHNDDTDEWYLSLSGSFKKFLHMHEGTGGSINVDGFGRYIFDYVHHSNDDTYTVLSIVNQIYAA